MMALADLRYALRQLMAAPAFTLAAVATLALGIGANSAIYTVIDAALFHPLPYTHPDRLIMAWNGDAARARFYSFSWPRFRFFEEHARDVADFAAYDDETVSFADHSESERLEGGRVSANFFHVLGVTPELGRDFLPEEDRHLAAPVALLSDRYWRRRYGADRQIVGRRVRVDSDEVTVIGVLPPGIEFQNNSVEIWRTRIVDTRTFAPESVRLGASYLTVLGRLRPGIALRQAQARLRAVDDLYKTANAGNSDISGSVYSNLLEREVFAAARMPLLVLWGAVGCLLLIACANVANLVLARALTRSREIAVRLALGASRARIARQLITEGVLLSVLGGVASLPVLMFGTRALVAAVRKTMSSIPDAHADFRVVAITFGVAAAIGIVFGLAPFALLMRGSLEGAIRAGGRSSSASAWSVAFREFIVAAEVALCLVLLSAAALLARSFLQMSTMETGLRTENVVVAPLDLMPDRFEGSDARVRFYDEVRRRAAAIPGVRETAITSRIELAQFGLGYIVRIEGAPDLGARNPGAEGRSVSPGYFTVLGIPLLAGRAFDERDSLAAPRVMMVNEAFAKKFFAGKDPVGRHVTYSTDRIRCEITGLVRDVRASVMQAAADPMMYLPLAQRPWLVASLLVRTDSPRTVMAAVREVIRSVDPDQAVADPRMLDQLITNRLAQPRTTMSLVLVFAGIALLLAAIGIYGVARYNITQRTREIAIRVALGANRGEVRQLVFRRSARILAIGMIAGTALSIAAGRLYESLLFEVHASDPGTLAGVALVLTLIALGASWFPAAQAADIDPLESLRAE